MKKLLLLSCILSGSIYASDIKMCESGSILDTYNAVKWYRVSAEKKAIYVQGYNIAHNYVISKISSDKLKPKSWGIVLDIDETILDNSDYLLQQLNACDNEPASEDRFSHYAVIKGYAHALPGSAHFTCEMHQLGGYVSLVTNRDGSYTESGENVVDKTILNLKKEGICFDQVLFANKKTELNSRPSNKNPRFEAVELGKYNTEQMVSTNNIPKHKVIAYLGDNIQDFPKLSQHDLANTSGNEAVFKKFNNGYFIFSNPIYGSWQAESLK